jgi:hypothetical protein
MAEELIVVKKCSKQDITMDVVNSLSLSLSDFVCDKVALSKEDDENLYDDIVEMLERFFNYPDYSPSH